MQVEAGESKLLLLETFSLFFFIFIFFTWASSRGARAPKNLLMLVRTNLSLGILDTQFWWQGVSWRICVFPPWKKYRKLQNSTKKFFLKNFILPFFLTKRFFAATFFWLSLAHCVQILLHYKQKYQKSFWVREKKLVKKKV